MQVELEPLESLSQDTLTQLFQSIFPEAAPHWDIQKDIKKSFKDVVDDCSAIAWKEEKPIGAIICVDRDGLQIDHIGVLQNHRRMGVGRMLLRHTIDNANDDVKARIPKENQAIIELMEEEGFKKVEEKEDHYLYVIETKS